MQTYKEEVVKQLSADQVALLFSWLKVAKQLHTDHSKPHQEKQCQKDDNQEASAVAQDLKEELFHIFRESKTSWQSESLKRNSQCMDMEKLG